MAAVLSRPETGISEDIKNYFRRKGRRNETNQRDTRSTDYTGTTSSRNNSPRHSGQLTQCDSLGILTAAPKYTQYSTLGSRIKSFVNWPKCETQNIEVLAAAGFAYTGVDDSVRCYYCSIGLRDWPEGACPWEQHVLASSSCGHVRQCKGKWFIRNVLGESDSESDMDDSSCVVDTVQLAIDRNKDAVSVARDYCSNEDTLNRTIKAMIKDDLQKTFTAVELVKAIQEIENSIEHESDVLVATNANYSDETDEAETDEADSESDEDIEEIHRQLKDPVTCKICLDAFACIITLPCGHMICCPQCISALTKCAICRAEIKGTVRAVMAV